MYKELKRCNFKIDLKNKDFIFEEGLIYPEFSRYRQWNKLIKKIAAI